MRLGDWQSPNHLHRHDQDNRISHDIGDLKPVVEFRQIQTSASDGGIPEFANGDADQTADETDPKAPEDYEQADGVDEGEYESCGEEAPVESEDGEFYADDAAGVQEGAGEEGL